jgi:hypothetical protein
VRRKRDPLSARGGSRKPCTLGAWRLKKVKAAGWVRWKEARKQLPKSPFSATLSQIHSFRGLELTD